MQLPWLLRQSPELCSLEGFLSVYLKMCTSGNRTAHQYAKLASHVKLIEGKVAGFLVMCGIRF
jgi:hypothetical protein